MRILICTGIYPPDIGGPATYSKLLFDELPRRGFKVEVLSFGSVRHLPKIIRHMVYFFRILKRALHSDIIFAQDPVSVGLPSCVVSKILGKKFVIRVAGDYAWEQAAQRFNVKENIDGFQNKKYGIKTEFLRSVQKFTANRANAIITPSIYFKNLVSGWMKNKNKNKVNAIYNGIKLSEYTSETKQKEKIILSAGRLVPWKGFDVLIEIMTELPDWRFIIVGSGPEENNLKLKIETLKLENRVELVGSVPREKMTEFLEKSKIFVLNTSFESFSFQVVEAMNVGIPVITTRIGNLSEIITDGKEGILVEPNNKKEIIDNIKKLAQNKDFYEEIIKNAKIKAQKFSIENTLNNLEQLLKTL
jgi:glycosyltransferase involved in cell wall biosynthesis